MRQKGIKVGCFLLAILMSFSIDIAWADTVKSNSYTVQTAIETGLRNSIELQQVENADELSNARMVAARLAGDELRKGASSVEKATGDMDLYTDSINKAQLAINQAKTDILNGILPAGADDVVIVPGALTIKAGDHILQKINDFNTATGSSIDGTAVLKSITDTVNQDLEKKQEEVNKGKELASMGGLKLVEGEMDYKIAKATIATSLANKLEISDLNGLTAKSSAKLMYKMAKAATEVTLAAKGIYKNQIALSIENSYYTALKMKKILEVKESTRKRAEAQYNFAKDGYEIGLKAKDDMLLAKIYYTGVEAECQKAQSEYENALTDLKRAMNIPMGDEIVLNDAPVNTKTMLSLPDGLTKGINHRLEIVQAEKMQEIYKYNQELVTEDYRTDSQPYIEATFLKQNADLELRRTEKNVENSIRQSYTTMKTMEKMLDSTEKMVGEATEYLAVAQDKYAKGYSSNSSLMKSLNLDSSTGTILEVISAQENLTNVEEKRIEIIFGYNLAKAKYLNDIAYLTY